MAKQIFRLNTFLTKRGFINITSNYGYGKVNAQWQNARKGIIISRSITKGITTIQVLKDNQEVGNYTIGGIDNTNVDIENFKNYINNL